MADDEKPEETKRERLRRQKLEQAQRHAVRVATTAMRHPRPVPRAKPRGNANRAVEFLTSYLQRSAEVVWEAIDQRSDVATARWLLDKVAADQGTVLPASLGIEAGDPVKNAEMVVNSIFHGRLSIEHGMKLLGVIEKQASLQVGAEIDELRAMVEKIAGAAAATTVDGTAQTNHPAWLKLKAAAPANDDERLRDAKPANDIAAE